MKACKDCKHRVRSLGNIMMAFAMRCKHPSLGLDPITGKQRTQYCSIIRRPWHECGPEGKMHEAK